MSTLAEQRDRIVADFRRAASDPAGAPEWRAEVRRAAIDRFETLGFPTRKREDWKYTNVTPVADALADGLGRGLPAPEAVDIAVDASGLAHALVFVDGRLDPARSHVAELPKGAVVDGLARVLHERPEVAEPPSSDESGPDDRAFVALNAAFHRDGALVSLPAGALIEDPIHVFFVSTAAASGRVLQPCNRIALGEGAAATVVVHHVSTADADYTKNVVSEVVLADDARLHHIGLECESASAFHIGTLAARIGRDARFHSHAISLGAALARHEIRATLAGTGAECVLDGLYVASHDRHVDNQTVVDHAEPHGTSRELYKGILSGRSKGVFNGTVIVRPDAQKTHAEQSNPNLLLTNGAEVDTRPNLEINADDVKCTHGSTVGALDDDAMFFLRARGISERSARQMLSHAFATEVIDRIPDEALRASVARAVDAALLAAGLEAE